MRHWLRLLWCSQLCCHTLCLSLCCILKISIITLLLRNNCIPLYQSSNFIWSLLNHTGSGTMLFSMTTWIFLFIASASAADISVSIYLYLLEASSVICKDPSHSNNASISFILLGLVLVPLCSLHYIYFVWQITLSSFIREFCPLHLSCKVSLLMLYQMLWPLLIELRLLWT